MKPIENEVTVESSGNYWLVGGLIAVVMVSIMMRDLERPIYGEHSWAMAHSSWLGRVQLNHGLRYTKGFKTWAVGDPPPPNPRRYLDHPQYTTILNAMGMRLFGYRDDAPWPKKDAAWRKVNLVLAVITLAIWLALLRGLVDAGTALVGALLYILFPLTGYFGVGFWLAPAAVAAFWFYLVLIGGLRDGPVAKRRHLVGLAVMLFLMGQFSWSGFFYAAGIGLHYVVRCIWRRQRPGLALLAVLIAAPVASLALDFTVMTIGYEGDWRKIVTLYKWRAGSGEQTVFSWAAWLGRFWLHAVTNFTWPVLLLAIGHLAWSVLTWLRNLIAGQRKKDGVGGMLWLLLLPGVIQLLVLKGCLWHHQTWERPLSFLVALSAALGAVQVVRLCGRLGRKAATVGAGILLIVVAAACAGGLDHYHKPHFAPTTITMLQQLNAAIAPDKKLLSFYDYQFMQNEAKGKHYHPVYAWYLDREIVAARSLAQIEAAARTGEFPFYLIPQHLKRQYPIPQQKQFQRLIGQLKQRYKFTASNKPYIASGSRYAGPYLIFNLQQRIQNEK